ncbi:hypothetical protein D918_03789, partial [Trichuris suis]
LLNLNGKPDFFLSEEQSQYILERGTKTKRRLTFCVIPLQEHEQASTSYIRLEEMKEH